MALLVVLDHIPGHYRPFTFSASAVLGFYFISGLLVTHSYLKFQKELPGIRGGGLKFYFDRFIRLGPLFFSSCILIALTAYFYPINISRATILDPMTYLLNFTMVPMIFNFPPYNVNIINEASWSLGSEFVFYFFLPLFIFFPQKTRRTFIILMVILHIGSMFLTKQTIYYHDYYGIGFLSLLPASDFFGYRFPFFTIAVFLLGVEWTAFKGYRIVCFSWCLYALTFFIFGQAGYAIFNSMSFDVIFGVLIFIPFALAVSNINFSSNVKKLDNTLGSFSFSVFVAHMPAINIAMIIFPTNTIYRFIVVFCITFVLALLFNYLQKLIDSYRYSIRGFGKSTQNLNSKS